MKSKMVIENLGRKEIVLGNRTTSFNQLRVRYAKKGNDNDGRNQKVNGKFHERTRDAWQAFVPAVEDPGRAVGQPEKYLTAQQSTSKRIEVASKDLNSSAS
jgi:hypothetical protein